MEEETMLANATAFSSFAVDDKEKARQFYAETLGLDVEQGDMGPILRIKLGDNHSTMVYEKPDFEPATYTVLNFEVPDIDSAVDELSGRGVSFERYEGFNQDEKGIARGGPAQPGPSIAWFRDLAGNILAVIEGK
jgi:predicted enzyme related to lactoylglutathione lyase